MFGLEPSIPAVKATKFFKEKNIKNIVELGAGLGRDAVYFAQKSIKVQALDYSKIAIESITNKAEKLSLTELIKPEFSRCLINSFLSPNSGLNISVIP